MSVHTHSPDPRVSNEEPVAHTTWWPAVVPIVMVALWATEGRWLPVIEQWGVRAGFGAADVTPASEPTAAPMAAALPGGTSVLRCVYQSKKSSKFGLLFGPEAILARGDVVTYWPNGRAGLDEMVESVRASYSGSDYWQCEVVHDVCAAADGRK